MIVKPGDSSVQREAGTEIIKIGIKFSVKLSKSADPLTRVINAWARKHEKLVLTREIPVSPLVEAIEHMEGDGFQLLDFVNTRWSL